MGFWSRRGAWLQLYIGGRAGRAPRVREESGRLYHFLCTLARRGLAARRSSPPPRSGRRTFAACLAAAGRAGPLLPTPLPLPLSPINLRYPPLSLVLRAATPPMQQRRLQPSWADSYSIRPPQLAIRLWIATARASALSAAPPWPRGALRLPQAAASEWRLRECRNGFRAPRLAPAEGGAARNAHVFPVCGAERASRSGTCDQPRIPCAPSAARASPFPGFPVATSVTQRRGRLESVAARRARRVPQAPGRTRRRSQAPAA